jgi:uncharacterized integral membrane protein (TIGR00698 family)
MVMSPDTHKTSVHPKSDWDLSIPQEIAHLLQSLSGGLAALLPGLVLCVVLGLTANRVGSALPLLGSGTSAILLGLITGNLLSIPSTFRSGVRFCESRVLEFAVACMGFSLSLKLLGQLGWSASIVVVTAVSTALSVAFLIKRWVKTPTTRILLIGVGTAICGSSAIAAAAPLIARERKEVGISVGVVSVLGIAGIFLLPLWTNLVGFNAQDTGLVIGGTLQSIAHVVAAGFSINDDVGNLAVTIKMGRVAMLVPLVLYLTMSQTQLTPSQKKVKIPWYLTAFLCAVFIASSGLVSAPLLEQVKVFDKFLLTIAMAAIGLNIHFKTLREQASTTLLYGAIIWAVQIGAVSLVASL